MQPLFAVTRSRGSGWNASLPMEDQKDWRLHADFMNRLEEKGIVLLAGPLEGTRDVLLIMKGRDAEDVRAALAADPWGPDMLATRSILAWTLRVGSLG